MTNDDRCRPEDRGATGNAALRASVSRTPHHDDGNLSWGLARGTAVGATMVTACAVLLSAVHPGLAPGAAVHAQPPAGRAVPKLPPRAATGPAPPVIGVTEAQIARGAAIYAQQCAPCHGDDGRGHAPAVAASGARPADQTDIRVMDALSDTDIARRIRTGGFAMPAFPHLAGDDLIGLVAHVRGLSRTPVRTVEMYGFLQREVPEFAPVTDAELAAPSPGDWLMFRRTYDALAYSPLEQITRTNVHELQLAWSRAMEPGGQYSTPLVHRGTLYVAHPGDLIQALDGSTGDLIWEYRWQAVRARPTSRGAAEDRASPARLRSVRNMAIAGGSLFHFTRDNHLVAIDARRGILQWAVPEARRGIGHMAGPIVADGKIISGRSCAPTGGPEICYVAAHAVADGRELWRVRLIPRPGEPGDETWGGLPYERRLHVGAWGVGSYDPALNLVYWGTSVPAPSLERLRGTPGQDVLFSNSTLAIDAATGQVRWYYQHLPRDNWDLDHVFERMLVDTAVAPDPQAVPWINPSLRAGERRKVITGIPGKTGIVYTLDRETGEFLWARETIHQNVVTGIDGATGRVAINEDLIADPFVETFVCPSLGGGKDWPAGAYSPRTGLMYQPQQNMCMQLFGNAAEPVPADGYATGWVIVPDPNATPGMIGRIDAVSIETGRTAWVHEQRAGVIGSLLALAGGVVVGGDVNRRLFALDDTSGRVLWQTILSGPVSGHAVSYAVGDRQFIAVPAGGNTASPERRVLSLHPEIRPPQGQNALFVFALPGNAASGVASDGSWWRWALAGLGVGVLGGAAGRTGWSRRRRPRRSGHAPPAE